MHHRVVKGIAEPPGGTCRELNSKNMTRTPGTLRARCKMSAWRDITLLVVAVRRVPLLHLLFSSSPVLHDASLSAAAAGCNSKTHYVTPGSQGITQPSTDGAH